VGPPSAGAAAPPNSGALPDAAGAPTRSPAAAASSPGASTRMEGAPYSTVDTRSTVTFPGAARGGAVDTSSAGSAAPAASAPLGHVTLNTGEGGNRPCPTSTPATPPPLQLTMDRSRRGTVM
jgi:hypothetical protein